MGMKIAAALQSPWSLNAWDVVVECGLRRNFMCKTSFKNRSVECWRFHFLPWQATWYAFAAIRQDGTAVTWGASFSGGDSAQVEGQLVDVHEIQATHNAFAAIVGPERRVVSWGAANAGGDCILEKLEIFFCFKNLWEDVDFTIIAETWWMSRLFFFPPTLGGLNQWLKIINSVIQASSGRSTVLHFRKKDDRISHPKQIAGILTESFLPPKKGCHFGFFLCLLVDGLLKNMGHSNRLQETNF